MKYATSCLFACLAGLFVAAGIVLGVVIICVRSGQAIAEQFVNTMGDWANED